jgi:hypothetical protein
VNFGAIDNYKRRQAERGRREQDIKAKRGLGKRTFRNPDRMVRFTWWVATFTFCLACVAFIQAWAFVQSERAAIYVQINGINPLPIIPDKRFPYNLVS